MFTNRKEPMNMDITGYKVNFLGDSITFGSGVTDKDNCRYDNRLRKMCKLSGVNNYGIGGTRLAHQIHPSESPSNDLCFCGRAYHLDMDADMVVVYGGVNDYLHGDAPFGQIGDTTPATFCGGVYFLMRFLREHFGDKPVVFMTPARCLWNGNIDDRYPSIHPYKASDAKPLIDYVEVILQTAKEFNIPVLDLYHNLGLDPHDPECCEAYTVDGLHFNDAGHEVIAQRLKEFIEAI